MGVEYSPFSNPKRKFRIKRAIEKQKNTLCALVPEVHMIVIVHIPTSIDKRIKL